MTAFLNYFSTWSDDFKKRMIKNLIQYGIFACMVFYYLYFFSSIKHDSKALDEKSLPWYYVGLILPMVVFGFLLASKLENIRYLGLVVAMVLATCLLLLRTYLPALDTFFNYIINFFMSYVNNPALSPELNFLLTLSLKALAFGAIIIGISIFYNVFLNDSYRQQGKTGFILYFLFFIPCLISDYIKYIMEELKMTPNVVYILLLLELAFILLYIYVPKLIDKIVLIRGTQIVREPRFIYGKQVVSNNAPFVDTSTLHDQYKSKFIMDRLLKNYSISMWITVNTANVEKGHEAMLFRYNDDLGTALAPDAPMNGSPYIAYTDNDNWKFVVSNSDINILHQLRNNLFAWVITSSEFQPWFFAQDAKYQIESVKIEVQNKIRNFGITFDEDPMLLFQNIYEQLNKIDNYKTLKDGIDNGTIEKSAENVAKLKKFQMYDIYTDKSYMPLKEAIKNNSETNTILQLLFTWVRIDYTDLYTIFTTKLAGNDAEILKKIKSKMIDKCKEKSPGINDIKNFSIENPDLIQMVQTQLTDNDAALKRSIDKYYTPDGNNAITTTVYMPSQRWHFIVFNYRDTMVDLFINGELERTFSLGNHLPFYRDTNVITIGNDKKTVHGAVCNVIVYPFPLQKSKISQTYNVLKLQNPPVNNIY